MSQSRRWVFTLNNYSENDLLEIRSWKTTYTIYGREVGENGTPHLQGFVVFSKAQRLSACKKLHHRCHWEVARGTSLQAADYCKKDGDYFESGTFPGSQGRRNDLERAIETLKKDGLASVAKHHTSVFVKYSRGLRDASLFLQAPYEHHDVRGIWVWGPPGSGKSYSVRSLSDSVYLKDQNKWWDGYDGELNVILDDLDTPALGHLLKIWSDRYACKGETKGGTVFLRHIRFIVTSNYPPEYFWPDDVAMVEAINRRFNIQYKDTIATPISLEIN